MKNQRSNRKNSILAFAAAAFMGSCFFAGSMAPVRADKSDKPIIIVVGPITKTPADPPKK